MELVNSETFYTPTSHRVFVLEDDLELSAVIERALRNIDATIALDWSTSVESATAHMEQMLSDGRNWNYDLIVADIFLDGKSTGLDFWRMCQEVIPDTPVLITSSLSLDRFFSAIGRHSISPPYLQKPFTVTECKQTFETILRYSFRDRWGYQ